MNEIIYCGKYVIGTNKIYENCWCLEILDGRNAYVWNREIAELLDIDMQQYNNIMQRQFKAILYNHGNGDFMFDFYSEESINQAMKWIEAQLIGITLIK